MPEPSLPDNWTYSPPRDPWLVVLHADRDLVAIDKPSGLLSVPGRGPELRDCAVARVAHAHGGQAFPAHRLDLDTSGVLLLALRRPVEAALMACFRERRVDKVYLARVLGHPPEDAGVVDQPLSREVGQPRSRVDPAGKAARTAWRVLQRDPDGTALLDLRPETGRSHQLRLHLLTLGHPILGDRFYAPPNALKRAPRLLLHAATLTLDHPGTGASVTFRAPCPFR